MTEFLKPLLELARVEIKPIEADTALNSKLNVLDQRLEATFRYYKSIL